MPRGRLVTFIASALLFLAIGGLTVYFALSIPNDIRAEALLKEARTDLQAGRKDEARGKFEEVVRNYPRTDAAAAATYALFRMVDQERRELESRVEKLRSERAAVLKQMGELGLRVDDASRQAKEAAAKAAAPKPAPKPTVQKKAPTRRTTTRRRRG